MDEHRRQQLLRDRNAIDEELALLRERRRINRELAGPAPVISPTNDDRRRVKQEKEVVSLIDDDDEDDHMRIKQEKKAEFVPPVDAPFPFAPSNMLFHGRPEPAVDHEHQKEATPARQGGFVFPRVVDQSLQRQAAQMPNQDLHMGVNGAIIGGKAVQPNPQAAAAPVQAQQAQAVIDRRTPQQPARQPALLTQQPTPPAQNPIQGPTPQPAGVRAAYKGNPMPKHHHKFLSLVLAGDSTGYYELRCCFCKGNYSPNKRDFLDGVIGLKYPMGLVHRDELAGHIMSNREVVERCKVGRLFTEEEISRKRKSPAPKLPLAKAPAHALTSLGARNRSRVQSEPQRTRANPKEKRKILERKRKAEPVCKMESETEDDDTHAEDPDGEFRIRRKRKSKAK